MRTIINQYTSIDDLSHLIKKVDQISQRFSEPKYCCTIVNYVQYICDRCGVLSRADACKLIDNFIVNCIYCIVIISNVLVKMCYCCIMLVSICANKEYIIIIIIIKLI